MLYDEIDLRNARSVGFWTGAALGVIGTFMLCLAVGVYYVS